MEDSEGLVWEAMAQRALPVLLPPQTAADLEAAAGVHLGLLIT